MSRLWLIECAVVAGWGLAGFLLAAPEAKVSFRLHRNVDWVAGYQYLDYLDYKERFDNRQFYQAHLPYTSLRVHFGRAE